MIIWLISRYKASHWSSFCSANLMLDVVPTLHIHGSVSFRLNMWRKCMKYVQKYLLMIPPRKQRFNQSEPQAGLSYSVASPYFSVQRKTALLRSWPLWPTELTQPHQNATASFFNSFLKSFWSRFWSRYLCVNACTCELSVVCTNICLCYTVTDIYIFD